MRISFSELQEERLIQLENCPPTTDRRLGYGLRRSIQGPWLPLRPAGAPRSSNFLQLREQSLHIFSQGSFLADLGQNPVTLFHRREMTRQLRVHFGEDGEDGGVLFHVFRGERDNRLKEILAGSWWVVENVGLVAGVVERHALPLEGIRNLGLGKGFAALVEGSGADVLLHRRSAIITGPRRLFR